MEPNQKLPFLSAKIFQTILLAINILKNSPEILTSDEQEFIIKLKRGSIGYAAYKKQKNLILHQLNEIKKQTFFEFLILYKYKNNELIKI